MGRAVRPPRGTTFISFKKSGSLPRLRKVGINDDIFGMRAMVRVFSDGVMMREENIFALPSTSRGGQVASMVSDRMMERTPPRMSGCPHGERTLDRGVWTPVYRYS